MYDEESCEYNWRMLVLLLSIAEAEEKFCKEGFYSNCMGDHDISQLEIRILEAEEPYRRCSVCIRNNGSRC